MTPEELNKIGRLLYGEQWKTELSRAIPYTFRAISYWSKGERNIPTDLNQKLIEIINEKEKQLRKLREQLENDC